MYTTTTIDMFTPDQAAVALGIDDASLLDLVNHAHLAAYDLGGDIRFKVADVLVTADALSAV